MLLLVSLIYGFLKSRIIIATICARVLFRRDRELRIRRPGHPCQ